MKVFSKYYSPFQHHVSCLQALESEALATHPSLISLLRLSLLTTVDFILFIYLFFTTVDFKECVS